MNAVLAFAIAILVLLGFILHGAKEKSIDEFAQRNCHAVNGLYYKNGSGGLNSVYKCDPVTKSGGVK